MTEKTPKIIDDVDSIYEGIQRVRREKAAEMQMVLEEKTEQPVDTGMFACLTAEWVLQCWKAAMQAELKPIVEPTHFTGIYPAEDGLMHGGITRQFPYVWRMPSDD